MCLTSVLLDTVDSIIFVPYGYVRLTLGVFNFFSVTSGVGFGMQALYTFPRYDY